MGIAENLDARLLRYRNDPAREDAADLAEALLGARRTPEALEVAGSALSESAEKGRLLLVAGQAWLFDGDLIRAQKALLKAARALPQAKEPYRWLGEVLLKRGDPARAVKVLDKALRIDLGYSAAKLLRERAGRLARLAESGDAAPAIPSGPPQAPHAEEATVIRPELSARLAGESQKL
ncbi:MAG: hypothetical protein GXP55_16875, partial [Deltaproteobacteria bacterium]|nr:hypothetical protein [Deltaproteobacteria bacterium]